jgi:hypothetical protein
MKESASAFVQDERIVEVIGRLAPRRKSPSMALTCRGIVTALCRHNLITWPMMPRGI